MTYPEVLAQAWRAATAPREPGAPTSISTFAGRGGSSTGQHMAGYRELLAIEWDDHACETLRLNYPHLDVWQGDIATLSVDEVLERTGLQVGELGLFDASPPCQGFSTSGRRAIDDPRNGLYREAVRLLRGLQPKAFVLENVRGLVSGKMKLVFRDILADLRESGYVVTAGIVNAAYLGVPQARERVIFIGAREDLGRTPTLPTPRTRPLTAGEALADLPDDPSGIGIVDRPEWLSVWAKMGPGRGAKDFHPKGHFFDYRKLGPDAPCPTITKTVTGPNGGPGIYHWKHPRLLSIAELKRLGSFPDEYAFPGDVRADVKAHQLAWAGIGNSVPPLMMRAIAAHIRETILHSP